MRKIRLGDVCSKIGSGATPKGGKNVYTDIGTSLIRSQNVYNLSFSWDGLAHITDEAASKLSNVTVEPYDILLNITGDSVARTCLVSSEALPARVNQHVAIIRPDASVLNPVYLSLYLASPYMQSYMLNRAAGKGASRNAITKEMIEGFEIPVPSMEEQLRIISILSPYGSLIENNQKQIKLLEEAAQRLYKEWFVDLHFPGHESTPIDSNTGLPKGWNAISLGEYVKFKRGKTITEKQTEPGGIPVVAGGLGPAYYHSVANAKAPVITISGSGANAGFTRLYTQDVWASDCSYVDSSFCPTPYFVFGTVVVLGNGFKHLQRGSAQPHVYPKHINALDVVIPDKEILHEFECVSAKLFDKIAILNQLIEETTEARNRLLPKLMEREIEVL